MYYKNNGYRVFYSFNVVLLIFLALACLFPLMHILAISFSTSAAAGANKVSIWPVGFNFESYRQTLTDELFLGSMWTSVLRVLTGVGLGLIVTVLTAYPLSKFHLKGGRAFAWFFVFTMLFNGGLIPTYVLVVNLGLFNSFWSLILPVIVGGAGVFNIILMLNFFRNIPKELEEASLIDGAGHLTTLFRIYIPVSLPSIATISLFIGVFHWNSWFDGLIFMSDMEKWPLSTFLQNILVAPDVTNNTMSAEDAMLMSEQTIRASQIFIGGLPILMVYPFLQRFFVKGIVLGSVKE